MEKIIENTKNNIFISANAGSGKTKVLVDRFIHLILSGVEISKILCITYTEEAAKVMLSRIFDKLNEILNNQNDKKYEYLIKNALLNINSAKIQTFHSFCLDEIKTEIEQVSGSLSVLQSDDTYTEIYCNYINKKVANNFEKLPELMSLFIKEYSKYTFDNLITECVSNVNKFEYLVENVDFYKQIYKQQLNCEPMDINEALDYISNHENLKTNLQKCIEIKENEVISSWLKCDKVTKSKIQELVDVFFTKAYKTRKDVIKNTQFLKTSEILTDVLSKTFNAHSGFLTINFIDLISLITNEYKIFKTNKNTIDYNDIIEIFRKNLDKSDFLYKVYKSYNHILVDEAQDLSQKQWEIIDTLFTEFIENFNTDCKTFFIVGDPKQSIYGFNGASINDFVSRRELYKKSAKALDVPFENIELTKSYRSGARIIDFVNNYTNNQEISKHLFTDSLHISHRNSESVVEILDIDSKNTEKYEYIHDICKKIKTYQQNCIELSDIMILFRKKQGVIYQNCTEILNKSGIEFSSIKGNASEELVKCKELFTNLLNIKNNDEYSTVSLLSSKIFNFSNEEILNIKGENSKITLQILQKYDKFCKIYNKISKILHISSDFMSFYINIMKDTEIKDALFSEFGENAVNTTVSIINEVSQNVDFCVLSQYLKHSETMRASVDNKGVKLATIHGSKGLEAKIVFLIDENLNLHQNTRSKVQNNIFFTIPDYNFFTISSKTFSFVKKLDENGNNLVSLIQKRNDEFELSEYIRLIYVAITRARDELIVYTNINPDKNEILTKF